MDAVRELAVGLIKFLFVVELVLAVVAVFDVVTVVVLVRARSCADMPRACPACLLALSNLT